jgi:AcrR family transcriptional regulator
MATTRRRARRSTTRREKTPRTATGERRRPNAFLSEVLGDDPRSLEALVEAMFEADLGRLAETWGDSPPWDQVARLHEPLEPSDREAVTRLVLENSVAVGPAPSAPAPSERAWLSLAASDVEVLCPGVTALMVDAAEAAGAARPGPMVQSLKLGTLGEFCTVGDEFLAAVDQGPLPPARRVDLVARLRWALRIVRVPLSASEVRDRVDAFARDGPALARRFRTMPL